MAIEQRALIIRAGPTHEDGLSALNDKLQRGWHVAKVTPMGGTGLGERSDAPRSILAALVVIERNVRSDKPPVAVRALRRIESVEDDPGEDDPAENGAGRPDSDHSTR